MAGIKLSKDLMEETGLSKTHLAIRTGTIHNSCRSSASKRVVKKIYLFCRGVSCFIGGVGCFLLMRVRGLFTSYRDNRFTLGFT